MSLGKDTSFRRQWKTHQADIYTPQMGATLDGASLHLAPEGHHQQAPAELSPRTAGQGQKRQAEWLAEHQARV